MKTERKLGELREEIQCAIERGLASFEASGLHEMPWAVPSLSSTHRLRDNVYVGIVIHGAHPAIADVDEQILLSDYFRGMHVLANPPEHTGVCNFRSLCNKAIPCSIYGCSQPTVSGIRHLVRTLKQKHQSIVWVNMREEPVLYLKGKSFNLRERRSMTANLTYLLGIADHRLEFLEERMHADILAYCRDHQGNYSYAVNQIDDSIRIVTEKLTPFDVQTIVQVFRGVYNECPSVHYTRIPVTDECAPEDDDFDRLVDLFQSLHPDSAIVFNCQMGQGRTTTGMVCAYIFQLVTQQATIPSSDCVGNTPHEKGDFAVVTRFLDSYFGHNTAAARHLKSLVDYAIDTCDAVQNLRTHIADLARHSGSEAQAEQALGRYVKLLTFGQYVIEEAPKRFHYTYSTWSRRRWGIHRLLRSLSLE